jgi:hypothetical protein
MDLWSEGLKVPFILLRRLTFELPASLSNILPARSALGEHVLYRDTIHHTISEDINKDAEDYRRILPLREYLSLNFFLRVI